MRLAPSRTFPVFYASHSRQLQSFRAHDAASSGAGRRVISPSICYCTPTATTGGPVHVSGDACPLKDGGPKRLVTGLTITETNPDRGGPGAVGSMKPALG